MMTGWAVALAIYALPILAGLRYLEELVEETKEWMRKEGFWYSSFAIPVSIASLISWPLLMAYNCIAPREDM
jgi:hypothetical protein